MDMRCLCIFALRERMRVTLAYDDVLLFARVRAQKTALPHFAMKVMARMLRVDNSITRSGVEDEADILNFEGYQKR